MLTSIGPGSRWITKNRKHAPIVAQLGIQPSIRPGSPRVDELIYSRYLDVPKPMAKPHLRRKSKDLGMDGLLAKAILNPHAFLAEEMPDWYFFPKGKRDPKRTPVPNLATVDISYRDDIPKPLLTVIGDPPPTTSDGDPLGPRAIISIILPIPALDDIASFYGFEEDLRSLENALDFRQQIINEEAAWINVAGRVIDSSQPNDAIGFWHIHYGWTEKAQLKKVILYSILQPNQFYQIISGDNYYQPDAHVNIKTSVEVIFENGTRHRENIPTDAAKLSRDVLYIPPVDLRSHFAIVQSLWKDSPAGTLPGSASTTVLSSGSSEPTPPNCTIYGPTLVHWNSQIQRWIVNATGQVLTTWPDW